MTDPDNENLDALIAWAREHPPGPEEQRDQQISWVAGELMLQDSTLSRDEAFNRARNAWRRRMFDSI